MEFARKVCCVFAGMVWLSGGVYAQETGQPEQSVTKSSAEIEALEKPLRDAGALMKAGKPAEAYALLEPLEFDRSGEVRFDYLIGIAALDSGKPDKATLAFERVMAVDPDYAGARLDMARAYYQLGDMPRAKTEFETVLKQNPSAAARDTINNYLDKIAAQQAGKQSRYSSYVEGSLGHDSNVNSAADQSGGITNTSLNSANGQIADSYFGLAAGSEVNHSLNANWDLYAGADLRENANFTQHSYDTLSLDGRAGVIFAEEADRFRIGGVSGHRMLGGSPYWNTSGFNAGWNHKVDPGNQWNIFGLRVKYRYAASAMKVNDFNQQALGFGWQHSLDAVRSTVYGSIYYGTEQNIGGRIDGANHFGGFRVGTQAPISETAKFYANAGWQIGHYGNDNSTCSCKRSDNQYDLTLGSDWALDKLWIVQPQLSYFRIRSNVAIAAYNRTDVSLMFRRNFK